MAIEFDIDRHVADIARRTTDLVRDTVLAALRDPACKQVLGQGHVPAANPGFLSARELTHRYAVRSGRDVSALPFHRALGCFKPAVIAEGVHARHRAGRTVGPGFDRVGSAVPALLRSGLSVDVRYT